MKNDKSLESKVIAVFVPGLNKIPGFIKLSDEKRDELLHLTSDIQQFRSVQRTSQFGEFMRLTHIERLLDGEEMQFDRYLTEMYPLHNGRTIRRKVKDFAELAARVPESQLKEMMGAGQDVLSKFPRIAAAPLGELLSAWRDLPLLPPNTKQDPMQILGAVENRLGEKRRDRRKPKPAEMKIYAESGALRALRGYCHDLGLKTSGEKRQFLQRVVGWFMQEEAVHGTLRCGRISVPDNIRQGPGRPKGSTNEEAA